jgi:hypothetical protein
MVALVHGRGGHGNNWRRRLWAIKGTNFTLQIFLALSEFRKMVMFAAGYVPSLLTALNIDGAGFLISSFMLTSSIKPLGRGN